MALDNTANFVRVIVSTGYTSAATSIVLSGSYTTPTAPFNLTWWDVTDYPDPSNDPNVEIVRCTTATTVSGTTTLTVVRAQESTAATNKNLASKTYNMLAGLTAKVINTDIPATYVTYNSTMTTAGGIPYVTGSGAITEDATNLFWNDSQRLFGVGTSTPGAALHINGRVTICDTGLSNDALIYCCAAYNGTNDIAITTNTPSRLFINSAGAFGFQTAGTTTVGGTISAFTGKWTVSQGTLTAYAGNNLAGAGQPVILATATATAQKANISTSTLLASTPAAGMYRLSAVEAITSTGGTSATLPAVQVVYTSQDAAVSATNTFISSNTSDLTSDIQQGQYLFSAGASTAVKYLTSGYASVGTATMSYSLRLILEYLG